MVDARYDGAGDFTSAVTEQKSLRAIIAMCHIGT
jgi:hypothetical protein